MPLYLCIWCHAVSERGNDAAHTDHLETQYTTRDPLWLNWLAELSMGTDYRDAHANISTISSAPSAVS